MVDDKLPKKTSRKDDLLFKRRVDKVLSQRRKKEQERKDYEKKKSKGLIKEKNRELTSLQKRKIQELKLSEKRRNQLAQDLDLVVKEKRKAQEDTFKDKFVEKINQICEKCKNSYKVLNNRFWELYYSGEDEREQKNQLNKLRNKDFLGDYLQKKREEEERREKLLNQINEEKQNLENQNTAQENNHAKQVEEDKEKAEEFVEEEKEEKQLNPKEKLSDFDEYLSKKSKGRARYVKEQQLDKEIKRKGF